MFATLNGFTNVGWVSKSVVLWSFSNIFPFNDSWLNFVNNTAKSPSIRKSIIKIINVDIWNIEGVNPKSESSLFSGSFDIIINHGAFGVFFLSELFETVLGVENVSDVKGKNLLFSGGDIICSDKIWDTNGKRVIDNSLSLGSLVVSI